MWKLVVLIVAATAGSVSATNTDRLAELQRKLSMEAGSAPIVARYESRHANIAHGRFYNDEWDARADATVQADSHGMTITLTPATLARLREQRLLDHRSNHSTPTISAVSAGRVAELLDYAPTLAAMLARSSLVEEHNTTLGNVPARLIRLNLVPKPSTATDIKIDSKADSFSIWIGADGLPLAAELRSSMSVGFLFLKATGTAAERWTFANVENRLVVTHWERTTTGSGMGQTSSGSESENITVIGDSR